MKRLTMNQVARASLKANRKVYLSLAVGVLLAVTLASAMSLGVYGTVLASERRIISRVGYADAVLLDAENSAVGITDENLRTSGLFTRTGKVYVSAEIGDSGLFAGYYDEDAAAILPREAIEGRLPAGPGEIALEQSAIEQLRLELKIGDTVTWTMKPLNGVPEKRTYTVVGILGEQAVYMKFSGMSYTSNGTDAWPNVLLWAGDTPFAVGQPSVHRVLVYGPLTAYARVKDELSRHTTGLTGLRAISRAQGKMVYYDPAFDDTLQYLGASAEWWLLGISLLLACGVAISGAMESVLASKTEEIGMLRAVGATRRQIRRLFGRDAWILCLAALPAGMALAALAVWIVSLLIPEQIVFGLTPTLLLPAAGLSALCVFLSSRLPLRRASRQSPMGVLRDTGMLRRARGFRSRKTFRPTALIAGRQTRLHPLRQAGGAAMLALTLLSTSLLFDGMLLNRTWEPEDDFEISPLSGSWGSVYTGLQFAESIPKNNRLTAEDIKQIRAIPQVKSALIQTSADVTLLFREETVPRYFRDFYGDTSSWSDPDAVNIGYTWHNSLSESNFSSLAYLLEDTDDRQADIPESYQSANQRLYQEMRSALEAWGLSGKLIGLTVITADLSSPGWQKYLEAGDIDLAAIDAGLEVVAYAPDWYSWSVEIDGVTWIESGTAEMMAAHPRATVLSHVENDYFTPGKELTLLQAIAAESSRDAALPTGTLEEMGAWRQAYSQMQPLSVTPTVGAVVNGFGSNVISFHNGCCLLTTEKGLRALGLEATDPTFVSVWLRDGVDEAEEEAVQRQLERIAMRGGMTALNRRAKQRENLRQKAREELVILAVVILFFSVTVAMQVGAAGRRIRADQRMIGTLRAVGADERALLGCYRLPMAVTAAAGLALSMGLYGLVAILNTAEVIYANIHAAVILPVMAVLAGLCALCCMAGVRGRLRQVLSRSVVENIREL